MNDGPQHEAAAEEGRAERHTHPDAHAPQGFFGELWDAVSVRTVGLIVGVLLLQLCFILSYVGAFHHPAPHRIPIDVVAPAQSSAQLVGSLNGLAGTPLQAQAVGSSGEARIRIAQARTSAALIVNPQGSQDQLLVTSAGGTSVSGAVTEVIQRAESAQQRTVAVSDVVPLQSGDGRGLTGFYLVIGWIVGGYLVAALLGVAKGARPATTRRAVFRLIAVVPYAVLSGLGGAVIVGPLLGALSGQFFSLWWLGALLVFAAAAVTMALQVLLGVLGIGATVLFFVVLGNPSAGGAYQASLLPAFWRALSSALPNGAGTDAVRRIVYFGSHGVLGHYLVIAAYAVGGVIVTLIASRVRSSRVSPSAVVADV